MKPFDKIQGISIVQKDIAPEEYLYHGGMTSVGGRGTDFSTLEGVFHYLKYSVDRSMGWEDILDHYLPYRVLVKLSFSKIKERKSSMEYFQEKILVSCITRRFDFINKDNFEEDLNHIASKLGQYKENIISLDKLLLSNSVRFIAED